MADDTLAGFEAMGGFMPPSTEFVPGPSNETIIPKSKPLDPTPDHVEALRLNPQFSQDFDTKFGPGAAARYLAQGAGEKVADVAKPEVYRPALSWSTQDILSANKSENPLTSAANSFVDGEIRKLQAARDGAALTSVDAFMRAPGPKPLATWLDDEIASAEYSIGFWKNEMSRSDVGGIAYNADYERAHARLEAARKAKADLEGGDQRTGDPQVQVAIATRIADQKGRVAYAQDQLDLAEAGDIGTGVPVERYRENLRFERKKLNALEQAMDFARQKRAVDGASGTGEMGRAFLRALMAETPEMLAGAVQQVSKAFGPEYGTIASEIAGEVKTLARGLKQDMPAPKQSEILALDPKSPEFANNLKLYAANALGQGIGSTAAFWMAALAGGPAGAGSIGLALGVGQMRNALEEEFAREGMRLQDHDVDAIVYSYGTAIGMLDAYGAMFNLGMVKNEVKSAAVRNMAAAIARGAAKGAVVEGVTEGLQEAIQIMGENHALERGMDWTKFRDRVVESFAAGTIPGAAFGSKNAHTEQNQARGRQEYEKILKQIEEASKIEPKAGETAPAEAAPPTVFATPETVSEPEQVPRGGRPLPPVQAEARDPATIPKPEPVPPQSETLSQLSKQEKADLLDVAAEAGIAKEGEPAEETLQRMREQRAEGASFGPFDEVFDRLDKIETEAEQQRAKDATIQPEDVEPLVEMWRFVEEARRVKEPEGIVDFLRRAGGVVDFGGDIRGTLGEARNRPGLVSNSGMQLDAAARLAWDNGFLISAERPDINALLDAISEDLAGNRVVRSTDRATVEDLQVARDMAEELNRLGIKRGMKEDDVRNTLKGITREGGGGTQDGATNIRGPQPRTIQEAFQKDALEAYLERGGSLDVSAWGSLAEALGVDRKAVAGLLDQAAADGLLRKHDGRYWRNPVDVFADDIPFALTGKPAVKDAAIEKHERIQGLVRLAIGEGQSVKIPKEITDRVLSEMRASRDVLPSEAVLAAIERIEPIKNDDGSVVPDSVVLTFRTVDGQTVDTPFLLSVFLGTRAFYSPLLGGVVSTRLTVGSNLAESIAGEVRHEAVHYRWNALDEVVRARLFAHASSLGVMEMQVSEYLAIVGDVTAAYGNRNTLREMYEAAYVGRPALADIMAQEAVAHMVELASHGYLSAEALAPVGAEMEALSGQGVIQAEARQKMQEAAERGVTLPDGTQVKGVPLYAIRAYHGSPHDFDKFDISKIGSGEGAQAYGHGLYFAENEGVAGSYRTALSRAHGGWKFDGKPLEKPEDFWLLQKQLEDVEGNWRLNKLVNEFYSLRRQGYSKDEAIKNRKDWHRSDPEMQAAIDEFAKRSDMTEVPGRLYEVSIKADPEDFLDWDKPLSQQSEKVRGALDAAGYKAKPLTYDDTAIAALEARQAEALKKYNDMRKDYFSDWKDISKSETNFNNLPGVWRAQQDIHNAADAINRAKNERDAQTGKGILQGLSDSPLFGATHDKATANVSARLREAGIPGIKYLDQGSRGAGEGSRNYVVFDDSLIEIVAKDGKPVSRGEMFAIASDIDTGRSMRRDLDALGYYSKALEAAKAIPQAKGTPEQMLAALKKAGVKDAEIEATNLAAFLDGKKSITRDEIVKHLTDNRVGVWEVVTKKRAEIDFNKLRDDLVVNGVDQGTAGYIINDDAASGGDPKATRAAVMAANQAIAEKLNSIGIDGIWYRNRHEGSGWSIVVWNKGQVRSATSSDVLMALRPSIANRTMPDGQRRIANPGTAEPSKSLSQLVADLNQSLGLTTRIGRLSPGLKAQASAAGGKLRGQYNTATDVTRLAIPLDIETLSHEGGHALEERFGVPLRVLMEANAKELEKLATPGNDQLSEGFAEFIRRYVTNPKMAEARAPKFFKAFEQFVDKTEPALLARLHDVTSGYQDWINAPSGGAVLSTIKSAKNNGLVAELTQNIRKNGFRNVAVDYFHSAYTAIIDGLHPVKMATDKLIEIANQNLATPLGRRGEVGVIAARDPYKLLRLARNAYQGGHVDLMRGVRDYHTHEHKGPSLHDAIGVAMGGFESSQWTDENLKAFGAYLISRRMVAEWNRFKAGELEGMPDKLSQADHIQAQKDFEQQYPQFIDAADLVYAYQKNLLRKAKDAGFVSEDTYDDLIKRTDYVPAHRDMSEDAEETVSGPGAQVFGSNKARLLKQFRGSTRDIINPLETIAKTTYEWNFLIARNDAIKALDRLSRAVGPGGGKIAERIPASQMSGTEVNAIEIVKRAGKQAGMDEADLLFLTTTLEEQLGDDADTVIFRAGEISEGGEPIVYLWEGGKRVAIRLADGAFGKDMYEAITGVGRENLGPIMEIIAKPSQWLRAGVTLDPAFVAANWLRDNPAAWINSADHGTFLPRFDRSGKASLDALRAAFGARVDDLDVLASTGGMVGGSGLEGLNASRVERDIKALQKKGIRIRDALPHKKQFWELTGVTETGTRLSVFRAARERALADGLDEYEATVEAAYTANDLIDFGRHGSKMLAARRLITFLNAFTQGIDKGLRTATGGSEVKAAIQDVISPYVRSSDGQVLTVLERQRVPVAAQFYAKMTLIGFIGYALSALYADDPEYEEIPEYFRNTHWVFKDATGTWRRIPKPFELGAMSLVMERTFEAYYKGDTKAMKRLVSGLGDLVTPPHVAPGVQVAYELWANKSKFSGGPIVPDNLQKLPGELQFTAYTSELSKWMAVNTGVSAAKIDHAIAGITGSLGRSLLDKSNVALPPVGMFLQERGMPTLGLPTTPRPEQRDVDRIFIRRFTVDPARSSQSKKEFWKEMSTTNGEMAIKAAGYKEFYDRGQFDEASENLKRMKEHERVYALIEGHGSANDKREHPMNRARDVLSVSNGIRRDLDTGKLKDDKGNAYSPSDRRVIQEIIENIQMREARNAQIVLGLPGFSHLKIMPVEPVIRELEAKVPSIAEELDFRLRKAKVKDFDEVREGYADLKARVLEPGYAETNPPRRKVGRRSP